MRPKRNRQATFSVEEGYIPTARDHFLDELVTEMEEMALAEEVTFTRHIKELNPTLLQYEHIPRLVDVAERFVAGEIQNLMILEPPRYFKTELFSKLLPSYIFRRHPRAHVGLASYGAELAWAISENARDYYTMSGGELNRTTQAKSRWQTAEQGEMWAAGVGGPMLGFGYNFGIVDDPTDPEKSGSYRYIKRFTQWWPQKWVSRGEPGAQKLVVMQRLGMTDPIDYLLRREVGSDEEEAAPEHWHIVLCDEIRSLEKVADFDGPLGLPATCTLEPDPRPVGVVLAPTRMDEKQVKLRQRSSGPYTTATQRQQRPTIPDGDFWKKEWFIETYEQLPDDVYDLGWDWDLAYTKNEANSASAGVRSGRGPGEEGEFKIYIDDVDWDWLEFPELIEFMKEKEGPHYIENKATGKSAKQSLQREGIVASEVTVSSDKMARSSGVQAVVSNARVVVRRSILHQLLAGSRQGLLNIRVDDLVSGKGDLDLNDAFTQGLTRHVGTGKTRRRFAFSPNGSRQNGDHTNTQTNGSSGKGGTNRLIRR